jgi:hypothetical protein
MARAGGMMAVWNTRPIHSKDVDGIGDSTGRSIGTHVSSAFQEIHPLALARAGDASPRRWMLLASSTFFGMRYTISSSSEVI